MVRLISCLSGSNKNSLEVFIRVSDDWLVDELTCPTSPCLLVGIPPSIITCISLLKFYYLFIIVTIFSWILIISFVYADIKRYRPNSSVLHTRDLNFVIWSEIFMHCDGQLRASHLILGCTPTYTSFKTLDKS